MAYRTSSRPFDEVEDEEEGMEVEASVDEEDIKENININPFASRHGKTLSWRGVNMTLVSFVFFSLSTAYNSCIFDRCASTQP